MYLMVMLLEGRSNGKSNAISKLARSNDGGDGATLFCTHAPCIECAKLIYGAGIASVFYREVYKNELGLDFLKKSHIEVQKHEQTQS